MALVHRAYRQYPHNPDWDHDHCEFCFATFTVHASPGSLSVGYCTQDEYRWICEQCFAAFQERFCWVVDVDSGAAEDA